MSFHYYSLSLQTSPGTSNPIKLMFVGRIVVFTLYLYASGDDSGTQYLQKVMTKVMLIIG